MRLPCPLRFSRLRRGAGLLACALLPWLAPCSEAAAVGTLDKIRASGQIFIGHRDGEIPFSYIIDGKVMGYSIDLCLRVADGIRKTLGRDDLEVVYVPTSAATRFIQLANGTIDLDCTTTTNSADRRRIVQFSYPIFFSANRFVAKKSSGLRVIKDLAGKTVVSTTGTFNVAQVHAVSQANRLNISVMPVRSHLEAFERVKNGQIAAFAMDDVLLASLVASSGAPQDFQISTDAFGPPEPYGIVMRPNDPAIKKVVNETLARLYTSGEINAIYAKWFTQPVPPSGINFNLPLSPELKAVYAAPREYLN